MRRSAKELRRRGQARMPALRGRGLGGNPSYATIRGGVECEGTHRLESLWHAEVVCA